MMEVMRSLDSLQSEAKDFLQVGEQKIVLSSTCPDCLGKAPDKGIASCTRCNNKGLILTGEGRRLLAFVKKFLG